MLALQEVKLTIMCKELLGSLRARLTTLAWEEVLAEATLVIFNRVRHRALPKQDPPRASTKLMSIVVGSETNRSSQVAPGAAESKRMLQVLILREMLQKPRTSGLKLPRNSPPLRSSSSPTRSVRLPSVLSHYVTMSNSLRLSRVRIKSERSMYSR